jgi:hypothetical protein
MSIYGYFACMDCKVILWLGKALFRNAEDVTDYRVFYFHMGEEHDPLDSEQRDLSAVLWKLLADHTDHRLCPLLDDSDEFNDLVADESAYEIGGDTFKDVSFADYLADWPGLLPPPQAVAEPGAPSARREVLTLVDPSFRAFERTLLRASLQLAFQGTLVLHVGDPIPVAEWLDQFARRRSGATLARYRRLQLLVLDPAGSPLYHGPLLSPDPDG